MTIRKQASEFDENPELTREDFARMVPFERLPDVMKRALTGNRPLAGVPREPLR